MKSNPINRKDFLKSIGIGATGLVISGQAVANIGEKPIKIYDNYVKGIVHYDFKKALKHLKPGTALRLQDDVDNTYDSFAIAVFYKNYKLGYVPAYENVVLANMLHQGVELKAYVSKLDRDEINIYQALAIGIYANLVLSKKKIIERDLLSNRADEAADIYRKGS